MELEKFCRRWISTIHRKEILKVENNLSIWRRAFQRDRKDENYLLFSRSFMFDSLEPHELKHARLPRSLPFPRACSNTCPLNQGCHTTILSSVIPFSSFLQSFPAAGSFLMSRLFASGGQVYWSFSFSISPSNEYSGLISFRIDCFDFLAVQRTLKSLLQHHSSKASILLHSAFFTIQFSHPYMTTGKTIALTRQTFVGKVMSLLFNMLSRLFIILFFPKSKHLSISWLQSPSAVILEPKLHSIPVEIF